MPNNSPCQEWSPRKTNDAQVGVSHKSWVELLILRPRRPFREQDDIYEYGGRLTFPTLEIAPVDALEVAGERPCKTYP